MVPRSHKVFLFSDSHCQREILDIKLNIRQKTSVDLKDHKASDSDSDLEDHKASDSYSNISIFCYGFRYASANPVFWFLMIQYECSCLCDGFHIIFLIFLIWYQSGFMLNC